MTSSESSQSRWWILGALGASLGIFLLDETVVGVALPSIERDLGLTVTGAHWVVNIYLLTLACLAAGSGRLADILGYRLLFIGGIVLFGCASIACGFATNLGEILIARFLQGVGAASIFPASMAMIAIVFPEEERGMAIGIFGAIGTSFLAAGPFVGGLLTETLSWRWIFWVNPFVVAGTVAVILTYWTDPPRGPAPSSFDTRGFSTLIGGLALVIFGLMQGPEWGWAHPAVWGSMIVGALLLVGFVRTELTATNPVVEIDLLKQGAFATYNLMIFTGQFTKIAVLIILSIFLQKELGMSPLIAGLALMAGVITQPYSAMVIGKMTDREGSRRPALIGLASTIVVFIWLALSVVVESYWLMLPALTLWGFSTSMLFIPGIRGGMNSMPMEKQGQVGGLTLTSQLLGGTVGMTLCGSLLAMTGSYIVPLLVTAALSAAVLVMAWAKVK